MHEVEPRPVGDPGRVRVTPSGPRDRVPAGVRYPDVRGEPLDVAGEQGEAGVGILVAPLEEDLHPHAHPEDGPARVDGRPDRGLKSGRAERAHAGAEAADAGDQHALGVPSLRSIGRDTDVCANVREGAGDREEVPHPIVEHRDPCRHSEPFVDGTPPQSVTAHASPSAFASALNSASQTWCGERPRFRWTCTVSSAACANARTKSSTRPVSNVPIVSAGTGTSWTTNEPPSRSSATATSVSLVARFTLAVRLTPAPPSSHAGTDRFPAHSRR